jgi:hypothetical protein
MSSVDQKRSPLPLLRLASLSLFWCLIFFLAFKTNLRYAFGDKVAAAISALAYASLLLLSWKEAAGQRRQALLFFLAVLTPLMPILLSMLPSEEPFLLPWLILDLWLLSGGTLLFSLLLSRHKESEAPTPTPPEPSPARFAIWGVVTLGILFFLMTGATGIGRQAIIDEALWTHERIPRFFQNIQEREFENTRVSDKPGVTITLAGGTALFRFSPSPTEERQYDPQAEALSTAFRLPILLTATLLLFFLFLFVSRATNPTIGALTVLLAGTAPVLIGVSRILNPDALLWGFFSLSFFAYFAFLRTQRRQDILWSGFFFGLALLTKYVSNFLLIFFIALTPLLLANTRSPEAMRRHLLKRLEPLLLFFLVGIGTFFVLYPATWMRPDRLLKATFLSQASLVSSYCHPSSSSLSSWLMPIGGASSSSALSWLV